MEGCDRRWSGGRWLATFRYAVREASKLTNQVARTAVLAKELCLVAQSSCQPEEEVSSALQSRHLVAWSGLKTRSQLLGGQLLQPILVHLRPVVRVAREETLESVSEDHGYIVFGNATYSLEHLQSRNGNALGSSVHPPILLALVAPLGASSSVKQDADEEEVDQASAALGVVDFFRPRGEELGNPVAASHTEVLIPAVARDARERGVIISLQSQSVIGAFPRVLSPPIAPREVCQWVQGAPPQHVRGAPGMTPDQQASGTKTTTASTSLRRKQASEKITPAQQSIPLWQTRTGGHSFVSLLAGQPKPKPKPRRTGLESANVP